MTLAQGQAVASAASTAGFDVSLIKISAGNWKVRATSNAVDIPIASANSLAVAQGVASATTALVEFV